MFRRFRIRRAGLALQAAQEAHNAALAAGDTRRQHHTRRALFEARHAVLRAGQGR